MNTLNLSNKLITAAALLTMLSRVVGAAVKEKVNGQAKGHSVAHALKMGEKNSFKKTKSLKTIKGSHKNRLAQHYQGVLVW